MKIIIDKEVRIRWISTAKLQ